MNAAMFRCLFQVVGPRSNIDRGFSERLLWKEYVEGTGMRQFAADHYVHQLCGHVNCKWAQMRTGTPSQLLAEQPLQSLMLKAILHAIGAKSNRA